MSRSPSRAIASWDVEKGDYLYDGLNSKQVRDVRRDAITGHTTVTFADNSRQERSKYSDFEFDTWDED